MKVLGIKQFHQMRFKFLPLPKLFKATMGDLPFNFIAVVYGYSGNGKTEFCMQLAKMLCDFGKVAWLSYEQRHGSDLQAATLRNKMEEVNGSYYPIDPIENVPEGVGLLEDLDNYLGKRNSPDFIFIDSLDYTGFDWEDYTYLKNKYGKRKSFIFISHSTKNGTLKKRISERVVFDGGLGIFVDKFIAKPDKNRYGGFEPYIIFEERARLLNPAFFSKRVKEPNKGKTSGVKEKDLFETEGEASKNVLETEGVRAVNSTKTQG
ncbi:AAA family ATPase [Cyclobacterium marinum]|uniref:AAA+ ATPase domain-containing protein n=1 Tax=Cyclobacterium marinum (strain ATCC 25205 / DSM 745 / LMG 13164 / NCIMB 1802) TaxID=880070 RepID=G0J0F4_CYCMS|nr:hypothetical protein [Cyclobacterium marinum]AEL23870.1 hypothetical protein Cycma_0085 [Cyclobacterium marinum DSM 745]